MSPALHRFALAGLLVASLLVAILLGAPRAQAHPHVRIDAHLDFVFERELLTGLRLVWTFDEFFSDYVLNDVGFQDQSELTATQIETIRTNAFFELRHYNFYTDARIDGDKIAFTPERVRDFDVALDGRKLVYRFSLVLPEPTDVVAHAVTISPYDPEYYVDVALNPADPIGVEGRPGCRYAIGENSAEPIYFGLINPIVVSLTCAGS